MSALFPTQPLRDLKSMKSLAGKTLLGPRASKGSNKPPSVSAQFNVSMTKRSSNSMLYVGTLKMGKGDIQTKAGAVVSFPNCDTHKAICCVWSTIHGHFVQAMDR